MKTSLVFITLFFQTMLFAQTQDAMDYMVLETGDTLYGTLEYFDDRSFTSRFYKKFRLTDAKGKTKKIKNDQISSFRAAGICYERFQLNQTSEKIQLVNPKYSIDSKNGEKHFLRVVSKGPLSHYKLEWWEQGDARRYQMDLLMKENDNFLIRATQGIFGLKKRVLKSYFSDCPNLAKKIENKEINNVYDIVIFFDDNCLN